MARMTKSEIKKFLMKDTFTAKLATVKKNGRTHVVPIWFVIEEVNSRNRNKVGNIYFTTGRDSVKAKNIQRDRHVIDTSLIKTNIPKENKSFVAAN